ncbi:MAG: hypothetical protein HY917_03205 [Candidatus Diapherotrites archaeon]|nr:hypothetical protein [Candidatus Diapherotrites archaeon]
MQVIFSPRAQKELNEFDADLRKLFFRHVDKVALAPDQRHMRFGLPFYVEEVTRQARLIYNFEGGNLFILRCFGTHKEYERWYKSYK